MFPSMNNTSDRRAVKNALEAIQEQYPPTNCLIEALYLCLESNNCMSNDKQFLETYWYYPSSSYILLI